MRKHKKSAQFVAHFPEAPVTESAQESVGARLRQFREWKKMTQPQMAAALGGTASGLKQNELGASLPNSKVLGGLYALGMNVNWLLSGEGPMLRADLQTSGPALVNAERLGLAIAAIDKLAKEKGLALSPERRGQLGALVYQYFMLDKAEQEAKAYLSQLMDLVSNH